MYWSMDRWQIVLDGIWPAGSDGVLDTILDWVQAVIVIAISNLHKSDACTWLNVVVTKKSNSWSVENSMKYAFYGLIQLRLFGVADWFWNWVIWRRCGWDIPIDHFVAEPVGSSYIISTADWGLRSSLNFGCRQIIIRNISNNSQPNYLCKYRTQS